MIARAQLAERFTRFLGEETTVVDAGGRLSIVTPAEYPNCDGVTVVVDAAPDGALVVSDLGQADALLEGRMGAVAVRRRARTIAERFDVQFSGGAFVATSDAMGVAAACWRVAQASAALAEGVTFEPLDKLEDHTFDDRLRALLESAAPEVRRNAQLTGLSGRARVARFFLPATEAVVEPVAGRKAWARAEGVYTEFGDLKQANGYRLVAVVDDDLEDADQLMELLSQVSQVGSWSRRDGWLQAVTRAM